MNLPLIGILVLVIGVMPAWAQGDQAGVPWSQLSPGEQQLLQRFSDNWDQLPPRKQQLLFAAGVLAHYLTLMPLHFGESPRQTGVNGSQSVVCYRERCCFWLRVIGPTQRVLYLLIQASPNSVGRTCRP